MSDDDPDDLDVREGRDEHPGREGRPDARDDVELSAFAGIDLAAWQPPPPHGGLADAVIARLREPASVPAVEPQRPARPGATRRAWIARVSGAVAVAAAVSGLALWGTVRTPRDGHGALVATHAEHLALDGTAADLDPGAELRWTRAGHRLAVHQQRGAVHWTVASDDILVLDPGGDNSAVTIEASGASLRVEVFMNVSASRVLGVTTFSAMTVAVVTVAVYQGHIKATSGGQTIQVEPGTTIELHPRSPPRPPRQPEPPDHRDDAIAVGVGPARDARALRAELAAADQRIADLTAKLAAEDTGPPADALTVPPSALDVYRLSGDPRIVPDEATRQQIASSRAVHNDAHIVGSFRLCVGSQGEIARVQVVRSTRFEAYDQTIIQGMRAWKFRPFLVERRPTPACAVISFMYSTDEPRPGSPSARAASCKGTYVEDLVNQAIDQYNRGFASAALAVMQKALACEQSTRLYRHAGIYACAAHDVKAARDMLAKLPEPDREPVAQRCKLERIALEPSR